MALERPVAVTGAAPSGPDHIAGMAGHAPQLTSPIADPALAWDAGTADAAVVRVSAALLTELQHNRAFLQGKIEPIGAKLDNAAFPVLRREAIDLRRACLDEGLGFVIIRGLEPALFCAAETENVFWRLCTELGEPIDQKDGGVKFGRVANLGLPAAARPRYHETGTGGSIHTDSPIMPQVADLVGLLCLSAAAHGGESKFVSVARVHDILLGQVPNLLAELYEPFYFDRRIKPSLVSAANPALLRAPIFSCETALGAHGVRLRWQPEYVWQALELPGVPPLTERQRLALHLLEGVLEDRTGAITVHIAMRAGDMQFLNNHRIAHGRTAFLDQPGAQGLPTSSPVTQREMRRVWLRRRSGMAEVI